MKEFSAQTGGRYTYVDDIVNLQDLSLAFASIFNGCDNFVISGCEVSGMSISSGYVYVNGKIRFFSGSTGITNWPQFIYESNKTETVAYASGSDKVGRNIYGCSIAHTVPSVLDPLTGSTPAFIKVTSSGALSIKDALFGKYALLLQPATGSQSVNGTVNFLNDTNVHGTLTLNGRTVVSKGTASGEIYYDGTDFTISSQVASGPLYRLVVKNGTGFQLYVNDQVAITVNENGISTNLAITTRECVAGNVSVATNDIINKGHASNAACININVNGYGGGTDYFRNTYIGNGKGSIILSIVGSTGVVNINGQMTLQSSSPIGMILSSTSSKDNSSLRKTIAWHDSSNAQIAFVGYNKTTDNVFEIKNTIAGVSIYGLEFVDLGPSIKENGTLLSNKYVTATKLTEILADKVDSNKVYSSIESDNKYATKLGGLTQFAGSYTKAQLRQHIEAISAGDADLRYLISSNLLSDIATTESRKAQICRNIGAAREGSYQAKLSDTGWLYIGGGLYARQIGNVVCIQGKVNTIHSGTVFTLPNSIDAPRYDASFSMSIGPTSNWSCRLPGNSKTCSVVYCNCHGNSISFSMTYMV